MTKEQATFKANLMLVDHSVDTVAKYLGITKPTLYVRLVKKNWKAGEISLLEKV